MKYTEENIMYYAFYLHEIQQMPWWSIKYCDEVHFESRGKANLSVSRHSAWLLIASPMHRNATVKGCRASWATGGSGVGNVNI
jgi:hypothetical protein